MLRWGVRTLLLVVTAVCGCYHPTAELGSPCSPDGTCPSGQRCDPTQSPPTCIGGPIGPGADAPDPLGDTPVVDIDAGLCNGTVCTADAPVCDPDGDGCRGCQKDEECASNACDELEGTCFSEGDVVYIAHGGDDGTGNCTRTQPCGLLSTGIAHRGARKVFAVARGTYHDSGLLDTIDDDLVISGGTNDFTDTVIDFAAVGAQDHTLEVVDTNVELEFLTLSGGANDVLRADGGADVTAIACMFTGGTGTANGIDVAGAGVHLFGVTIADNQGAGLHATTGALELDGCYIDDNQLEGIASGSASYSIINTVLYANHRGGMYTSAMMPPSPAVFSFNTVFQNDGTNNAGMRSMGPATVSNTIFADNGTMPQVNGANVTYSLFTDSAPPGIGNLVGAPDFVDPANGNVHIQLSSAALDAADPNATLDHDYDDDHRPKRGRADIGCDEH
jgi:hypothetical protein